MRKVSWLQPLSGGPRAMDSTGKIHRRHRRARLNPPPREFNNERRLSIPRRRLSVRGMPEEATRQFLRFDDRKSADVLDLVEYDGGWLSQCCRLNSIHADIMGAAVGGPFHVQSHIVASPFIRTGSTESGESETRCSKPSRRSTGQN